MRQPQLEARGFRVLRVWNDDVLRYTDAVLEQIHETIEAFRKRGRRYGG